MNRTLILGLVLAAAPLNLPGQDNWTPIQYMSSSIWDIEGSVISLLGGGDWRVQNSSLILPIADATIVLEVGQRCGILVSGISRTSACHLSGALTFSSGYLTHVVAEYQDGAVLQMSDGSLWEVPRYDQYDTGWWLPPYQVIITADELYMINLDDKGKRVWISRRELAPNTGPIS